MVALVNSHSNATSRKWHLWEIDLIFVRGLPQGGFHCRVSGEQVQGAKDIFLKNGSSQG